MRFPSASSERDCHTVSPTGTNGEVEEAWENYGVRTNLGQTNLGKEVTANLPMAAGRFHLACPLFFRHPSPSAARARSPLADFRERWGLPPQRAESLKTALRSQLTCRGGPKNQAPGYCDVVRPIPGSRAPYGTSFCTPCPAREQGASWHHPNRSTLLCIMARTADNLMVNNQPTEAVQ